MAGFQLAGDIVFEFLGEGNVHGGALQTQVSEV
jgi:hypothetical protein